MTIEPRCDQFRPVASATESGQLRIIERQVHVNALARLERDAERDELAREAEIEQLQTIHLDLKRQARNARVTLNEALARVAATRAAYSQLHQLHSGALLDSADPAIAEFLASMAVERDTLQEACRSFRNGRRSDFAAVNARIAAINDAIEEAAAVRLHRDQSGVRERLNALRESLPAKPAQLFGDAAATRNASEDYA